jgi:hypothetical protein
MFREKNTTHSIIILVIFDHYFYKKLYCLTYIMRFMYMTKLVRLCQLASCTIKMHILVSKPDFGCHLDPPNS